MEHRAYDPDRDFEAFFRLVVESGWADDTERAREAQRLYARSGRTLVAEAGGGVESFASTHEGTILHSGTELPLSVVSGVATGRVARRRGLALRLSAEAVAADRIEKGAAVAILGIFDQGFYDRLGFGTGPYDIVAAVDPAEIRVPPPQSVPVRLGADDWERIHASRLARRRGHGSIVLRDSGFTRWELLRRDRGTALGFEDPATKEITHHFLAVPGPKGWWVAWFAYRTPGQFRDLFGLLASLADQEKLVSFVEPPGIQVQSLVARPFRRRGIGAGGDVDATSRAFAWWQARILDLPSCVAACRLPGSEAVTFQLSLSDPISEYLSGKTWSGVAGDWTVTFGPESHAEPATGSGLPRLETSVGTFTRLWLGAARATDLSFVAPDLRGPPELLERLDAVLRLPRPCPDWDI